MLRGAALLASNLVGSAARIALDEMRRPFGFGLPTSPEALARPEVVDALLRDARPPGAPLPARVTAVRLPGVDALSERLGLPGHAPAAIVRAQHKLLLRRALSATPQWNVAVRNVMVTLLSETAPRACRDSSSL